MKITSENAFETAIIESLLSYGGYSEGDAGSYSPELCMFKVDILQFLQATQTEQWDKLAAIHGEDISNRVIARLYKEMDLRGALDVIRNGLCRLRSTLQDGLFQAGIASESRHAGTI